MNPQQLWVAPNVNGFIALLVRELESVAVKTGRITVWGQKEMTRTCMHMLKIGNVRLTFIVTH